MSWNDHAETNGSLTTKGFTLQGGNGHVPGLYWEPAGGSDRLVLLGHGGTANKSVEYILFVAGLLAEKGIASLAIDAPGHGERADTSIKPGLDAFPKMWHGGGGHEGMLVDWRLALDFIEAEQGPRPTGWWGLSMGTMMGLPVTATDDRIKVAQLGLMGTWGPNAEQLRALAPKLECPVRFLVQWDDEVVPREQCLTLFDLIGSKRKTLHANPGLHKDVPVFEMKESVEYLDSHLR